MKKLFPILLMSLGLASGAFAQTASGGVTMSTDPAKAAAVEKHAQEIKAHEAQQQQAHAASKPAAKSKSASTGTKAKSQPKTKTNSSTKPSATK
jgi:hypothetical protein